MSVNKRADMISPSSSSSCSSSSSSFSSSSSTTSFAVRHGSLDSRHHSNDDGTFLPAHPNQHDDGGADGGGDGDDVYRNVVSSQVSEALVCAGLDSRKRLIQFLCDTAPVALLTRLRDAGRRLGCIPQAHNYNQWISPPRFLFGCVAEFLTVDAIVATVGRVSHRWNFAAQDLEAPQILSFGHQINAPLAEAAFSWICKRKLKNVTELDCRESTSIGSGVLPVIGSMVNLRRLCLSGCERLALDEKSLANLPGLTELDLSRTSRTRVPAAATGHDLSCVTRLPSLRKLNLSLVDCRNIDRLSALTGLRSLQLAGCVRAQSLAFLRSMPELERLDISGCCKLAADQLRHAEQLTRLRSLAVDGVPALADGLQWVWPDALEELSMTGSVRHVGRFPRLRRLAAGMASEVKHLNGAVSIEELDIETNALEAHEFEFLSTLPNLKKLNLNDSDRSPTRAFPYLDNIAPVATATACDDTTTGSSRDINKTSDKKTSHDDSSGGISKTATDTGGSRDIGKTSHDFNHHKSSDSTEDEDEGSSSSSTTTTTTTTTTDCTPAPAVSGKGLDSLSIRSPVVAADLLASVRSSLRLFASLKEFVVYYRYCPLSVEERTSLEKATRATVQWRTNWD